MPGQPGFFDVQDRYEALSRAGDPLEGLRTMIPWESFRKHLKKTLQRKENGLGGRPPFDDVLMFKVLVLQALYNLSDDQTEYQIRDRLSFMRFLGLDMDGTVPDAKTIWLFRERLARAGAVEKLFARFDRHLEEHGLMANGGQIIDASIIPVPKQRNDRDENDAIKAGETPKEWKKEPAKLRQKDVDARWAVKNKQNYYGYKNHVNTDKTHKLIRRYHVTDASVHDSSAFDEVFDKKNTAKDTWADAAYRAKAREEELKARGYRSRIHYKGTRGHPLSEAKQATNTRRSRVRARVEHVFGRQAQMGGKLVRCIGIVRARANIGLKNLAYNLQRFVFLAKPAPA
ncbi:MAG TPA: IS5 family transposase [Candidatus Gracilibacteria bacterium]|nr:IS5 family transposase [Candidatus Gracilibacteria bacterium]